MRSSPDLAAQHYDPAPHPFHATAVPRLSAHRSQTSPDFAEPELPLSLAAQFPSTLRQEALPRELAVLAYHFWETRGCLRGSLEDDTGG